MRTLRSRLILSHILPLVIVLPLVGVALVYLLETQVFLQSLADEMQTQALLTAAIAANQPEVLQNSAQAQIFITRFRASNRAKINLLDQEGTLLASSNPADSDQVGIPLNTPNVATALAGDISGYESVAGTIWVAIDGNYVVKYEAAISGEFSNLTAGDMKVLDDGDITMMYELSDANGDFSISPPAGTKAIDQGKLLFK